MENSLKQFKTAILSISEIDNPLHLVQLFELISSKIDIDTIQGMAKKEGKSYNGIKTSNQYDKIKIGSQTLAIKGVKKDQFPF